MNTSYNAESSKNFYGVWDEKRDRTVLCEAQTHSSAGGHTEVVWVPTCMFFHFSRSSAGQMVLNPSRLVRVGVGVKKDVGYLNIFNTSSLTG